MTCNLFLPRILFALFLLTSVSSALAAQEENLASRLAAECSGLDELQGSSHFVSELVDPVLHSMTEVVARQQAYEQLFVCLSNFDTLNRLPPSGRYLKSLLELFLIFAGSIEHTTLAELVFLDSEPAMAILKAMRGKHKFVDLGTSTDPAVKRLRDDVKLNVPPGLVYIRFFPQRSEIPAIVRPAFDNRDTIAVTLLGRYIAVLEEANGTYAEQQLAARTLPTTVSHELVHSFIMSTIPIHERNAFPRWFSEGCAIYFSGSGKTDSAVDYDLGTMVYRQVKPSKEYYDYGQAFQYLESVLGRAKLEKTIKECIDKLDSSKLLQASGASTEVDLIERSRSWHSRQELVKSVPLLVMAAVFVWWLFRKPKSATCNGLDYSAANHAPTDPLTPQLREPKLTGDDLVGFAHSRIGDFMRLPTDGREADLLVEMLGSEIAMKLVDTSIQVLRKNGREAQSFHEVFVVAELLWRSARRMTAE